MNNYIKFMFDKKESFTIDCKFDNGVGSKLLPFDKYSIPKEKKTRQKVSFDAKWKWKQQNVCEGATQSKEK